MVSKRSLPVSWVHALLGGIVLALAGLSSAPARAAELVMFDAQWCGVCQKFKSEMAPIYPATAVGRAIPLRIIDMRMVQPWFRLMQPIRGTPTFVLVEGGQELARIEGYTTRERFMQRLEAMAVGRRHKAPSGPRLIRASVSDEGRRH